MNSEQGLLVFSIFLLGAITFCYRFSFVHPKGRQLAEKIPPGFLALLGPATFSAIIANNLLASQSDPAELQRKIVTALLALAVAYFTKSVVATLIFGLGLLACLQHISL
ncbi:MAG TPA: AzlD domain-containing protein [Pseudobdellovibrionaceae bacterium]|nr:AzlD domain-containing protein [Pseudobdellovibrionaceae bacterium]